MSKRVASFFVLAGVLAGGGARAADLDGFDAGPPPAYRGHPAGPVVYDERLSGDRFAPPGPGWPGADGIPPRFGPRPAPALRAARLGPDFGAPEVACTVDRTESLTPLGWRKTVTVRTCYRR